MSLIALLAPIAILFPAAGDGDAASAQSAGEGVELVDVPAAEATQSASAPGPSALRETFASFRIPAQEQVRIEQRMTIRIAPRPAPTQPMMFDMPDRDPGPRLVERSIGKCVAIGAIAGVQPDGNRLLLYMRDRRIVSAALERACRPRDFYSGFYLQRSEDGQLCVDRDTLLSRSGANCKLTRLRQLIELDD